MFFCLKNQWEYRFVNESGYVFRNLKGRQKKGISQRKKNIKKKVFPGQSSGSTLKDRNKNGALTSPAFSGPRDDSQIS